MSGYGAGAGELSVDELALEAREDALERDLAQWWGRELSGEKHGQRGERSRISELWEGCHANNGNKGHMRDMR